MQSQQLTSDTVIFLYFPQNTYGKKISWFHSVAANIFI